MKKTTNNKIICLIHYIFAIILLMSFNNIKAQNYGQLDTTFNPILNGFTAQGVTVHAVQSDGKIIICGIDLATYNGVTINGIARLNTDGTIDNTFVTGSGLLQSPSNLGSVYDIEIQSDGKILLAGNFFKYNGVSVYHLIRLNSNGSLDTTFNVGTGGIIPPSNGSYPTKLLVLPNNQIIVAGSFWTWNGAATSKIVKLNSNGSRDITFTTNSGNGPGPGFIYDMKLMSNGNILICGNFLLFKSLPAKGLAVIGQNGSVVSLFPSASFQISYSGGAGYLSAIFIESTGKIVIGGKFKIGTELKALARFNSDGSTDSTFNFSVTNINSVSKIIQEPSTNKYIIGEINYNVVASGQKKIVRISNNGSNDSTFILDSNISMTVIRDLTFLSNGKLFISGRGPVNYGSIIKNNLAMIGEYTPVSSCISGGLTINLNQTVTYSSIPVAQCSMCYDWDINNSELSSDNITVGTLQIVGTDKENSVAIKGVASGPFILKLTYIDENGCSIPCTVSGNVVVSKMATNVVSNNSKNNSFDNSFNKVAPIDPVTVPCSGPLTINLDETVIFIGGGAQCTNCFDWDINESSSSSDNSTVGTLQIIGSDIQPNISIKGVSTGTFTIQANKFTENGCETCLFTGNVVVSKMPSLDLNKTNLNDVILFPNPTSNIVNINSNNDKIISCKILNFQGESISTIGVVNQKVTEIDLTNQKPGVYLIEITTLKGVKTFKIVKI